MVEGQLVSSNDKFYWREKESTFFYANVVPIWRQINDYPGNWNTIGSLIRQHALKNKRKLEVWAGAFDVLKLGGEKIFLYGNKSHMEENRQIPVPKKLYKCVVDKEKKEALCFIVINNPYLTLQKLENPEFQYMICNSVGCNREIYKNFTEFKYGYTYCCSLRDFYVNNGEKASLPDVENFIEYKILRLN